ncbi:MAG: hypothetical protein LUE64_05500, partial [Candidatus Gastranaerophilales bacterium]|nr:hypothetical protein [Candidatus Gastranaerophilales bacterium]
NNSFLSKVKMGIKGRHNVYNCLAVLAVLLEEGFELDKILPHFLSFGGMKRRFETVYNGDITVVDDYAHHPTEIHAALCTAKKQAKGKIVAIFQPHRYTRLKNLWKDFLNVFDGADELFVVDTFSAGDEFDENYNSKIFAGEISHKFCKYIGGNMTDAVKEISKYIEKGDFVLTIGAGDVTKIGHELGGYYERNRT